MGILLIMYMLEMHNVVKVSLEVSDKNTHFSHLRNSISEHRRSIEDKPNECLATS